MINKHSNKDEILAQAETLHKRTLRSFIDTKELPAVEENVNFQNGKDKGLFGKLTEFHCFNVANNSRKEPDFPDAGIELKTTGLKLSLKEKKLGAKERLVFSMIDFMEVHKETWLESSFLAKNQKLLIMFYLWNETGKELEREYLFHEYLDLLNNAFAKDIVQIEADWNKIVQMIREGKAGDLKEGKTSYLAANTKHGKSYKARKQPFSDIMAKPRSFVFKQKYFNFLVKQKIQKENYNYEHLIKDDSTPQTIESFIESKLKPFYGKTEAELCEIFGIVDNNQKQLRRQLVNGVLGLKGTTKVEEFEKSNTTLKVIKLEEDGNLVQSVSFPHFEYLDLVKQEWLESDFYDDLTSGRFVFVAFRTKGNSSVLEQFKFWTFPDEHLEFAELFWERVVMLVKEGKADKLPGLADNDIMHIRPHATKGKTNITPSGDEVRTKCFWLNANYIKTIFD